MKKNKSLTIVLIILAFIVLMVILSSAIFCVRNVELNFLSETINLTGQNEQILASGGFKMGKSVFFCNKNEYIKNLEENNPYIKVLNIETIFPSTLRVNAIERNELLCIKGYEDNSLKGYMILDDELKVLNNQTSYQNTYLNSIFVNVEGEYFENVLAGQVLNNDYSNILKSLSVELLAYRSDVRVLKSEFKEIDLSQNATTKELNITIKMRTGAEIVLQNANNRLMGKFMLALSTYDNETNKSNIKIVVYENNDGEIVGYKTTK